MDIYDSIARLRAISRQSENNCGVLVLTKYLYAVLAALVLASSSGPALADATDARTLVLSNELGPEGQGGLIDRLITAGHGSDNLYQVLQLLAAQPGAGIPADFVTSVGNNLPGSEVFTAALSDFAGLNGPVSINADGTLGIPPIFGRDFEGDVGYVTNRVLYPGIAAAKITLATAPIYYIDAGVGNSFPNYLAIGIAYGNATRTLMLSNESPGYLIDKLIAAGHGGENLLSGVAVPGGRAGQRHTGGIRG